MSTPQKSTSWDIMSVNIDGNSRAPPQSTSSISVDTTYHSHTASHSRESLAQSHISFHSEAESETHLLRHSPHSAVYHRDIDNERRIWSDAQRTTVEKFSDELRSKLSKVRQTILRESAEALETRRLLSTCRTSPLAAKVQKARKACALKQRSAFQASSSSKGKDKSKKEEYTSSAPTPVSSTPGSSLPSLPALSTGSSSPLDSRKGSIASILSALSPRRSSTTTLNASEDSTPSTPLRQRKISAPLEYDPRFHPRQLSQSLDHRNGSISSESAPLFRMPRWTPPSEDDCRACEIIRIVADTIHEEEQGGEGEGVQVMKVLRRLSDGEGNLFIEQVRERDERGRKRVLFSWGVDVDVVIPEHWDGGDDGEDGAGKSGLRRRLGERYQRLCEVLRRVFVEERRVGVEAGLLGEVYP